METTAGIEPRAAWWRGRLRPGVAVLAAVAATPAIVPVAAVEDGPVLCPFRRLTGLPCPGCGLTRSVVHFAHGDVGASIREHAFGPVVYLAVVATVVAAVGWRLGSASGVWARAGRSRRLRAVATVVTAVWIAWAAVRLGQQWADGRG